MKITDALLTMGANHGRTGRDIYPMGIVVNYVANPGSSAMANRNYYENGSDGRGVSSHYIVGLQGEVIRCIPETEIAMHAGGVFSSAYLKHAKTNNSIYFSIGVCYPVANGKLSNLTNMSLIELCADICARHGFDPQSKLFTHNQVTGKPSSLDFVKRPEAWSAFKQDVQDMISGITLPSGHVNLSVDNKNCVIEAFKINGRLYSTLDNMVKILGGTKVVNIRDVLEANNYTVTWNELLLRITAFVNNNIIFSQINADF